MPFVPVAQKEHPIFAQPTCDETHIVVRFPWRINTVSTRRLSESATAVVAPSADSSRASMRDEKKVRKDGQVRSKKLTCTPDGMLLRL
jgi:hypothetical protein